MSTTKTTHPAPGVNGYHVGARPHLAAAPPPDRVECECPCGCTSSGPVGAFTEVRHAPRHSVASAPAQVYRLCRSCAVVRRLRTLGLIP